MSIEEAFKAAVNIIRSMPKDGPFQPSPDLMLRFYALYKQATEGRCTAPKPSFWAVINKAKWDAWKNLGNMPKEEAMRKYVEELKQIVETMSYSEDVANFMHVLGPFYEAVYDGQEPDNMRRNPSPNPSEGKDQQEDESGYSSSINGTGAEETESADLESENNNKPAIEEAPVSLSPATSLASVYASEKFYSDAESDDEYKDPLPDVHSQSKSYHLTMNKSTHSESGEQLHVTMAIQRLQADLQSINSRLEALEEHRKELNNGNLMKRSTVEQVGSFAVTYGSLPSVNQLSLPSWFPFKNMNVATILVILGWPLAAQYLVARLRYHRPTV